MAAVTHDEAVKQSQGPTYTVTAVTIGTYEWLQQEVGLATLKNPNRLTWTHTENQLVDSYIQRGLKTFYNQALSPQTGKRHRWSFLRAEYTIATVAPYSTGTVAYDHTGGANERQLTLSSGTWPSWAASGVVIIDDTWYEVDTRVSNSIVTLDATNNPGADISAGETYRLVQVEYDLPTNFGGMDGPILYKPGFLAFDLKIPLVGEYQLPEGRQRWDIVSFPQIACLKQKTPSATYGAQWAVSFYPTPDTAYQFVTRIKYDPTPLTAGKYPMCGSSHYETALLSCLAVANPKEYLERYQMALTGSIEMDQAEMGPESLGRNLDRSDGRFGDWRETWRQTDVTVYGEAL
jgi:hypothetical protein